MGRKQHTRNASGPQGPSQRQLRAGELIRHALVDVLRENEIHDEALLGISITVTEVRLSPDLKHATCFVEPLGAGVEAAVTTGNEAVIIKALNTHTKFLRGQLGRHLDMKFTPELKFRHDDSFDTARHIDSLFNDPKVRADLDKKADEDGDDASPQVAQSAIGEDQEGSQVAQGAIGEDQEGSQVAQSAIGEDQEGSQVAQSAVEPSEDN